MNTNELTYLLNKPHTVNEKQTQALEQVLLDYPYFQGVRALYLKGLFNQESFRYNYELKKVAAHTFDRSILFDFITSRDFKTLQKNNIEAHDQIVNNITVTDVEEVNVSLTENEAVKEIIKETTSTETEKTEISVSEELKEKLEIGKPLAFENNEKHSFNEWLQLTKFEPINRETEEKAEEIPTESDSKLAEKINLIDKFIENNPKISPVKESVPAPANISKSATEPTHLMTETLAKILLEQKKYTRAIQAYEILILKYPEKSSFFADRIENIKKLQQNNN